MSRRRTLSCAPRTKFWVSILRTLCLPLQYFNPPHPRPRKSKCGVLYVCMYLCVYVCVVCKYVVTIVMKKEMSTCGVRSRMSLTTFLTFFFFLLSYVCVKRVIIIIVSFMNVEFPVYTKLRINHFSLSCFINSIMFFPYKS